MTPFEFDDLHKRAEKGDDPKAMLDVALAFSDGDGVDQNDDEFFAWVKKSAEAGEPEAAYELAYAYRNGIGTKPDQEGFIEWLDKATELGFLRALYETAIRYKDGDGVPSDEKRFFLLMKEAATRDYEDAMLELAFAYRDKVGTTKRLDSYFRWLTKAAEADNAEAMFHLAFAYRNGEGIKRQNLCEFFQWLYKAAQKGQPDALFHLAIAYKEGEGTEKSPDDYSHWMKKAAEAGIPAGMYHLAIFYLTKEEPDLPEFSRWIKSALKEGHPKAFIASGLDDLRKDLQISPEDLVALLKDLNMLYETVMRIKQTHLVKKRWAKDGVAHFTGFPMLDSVLPEVPLTEIKTNRLRLYNFAYMNDPQEGKRLIDGEINGEKPLKDFFFGEDNLDNPLSWEGHESSVYIGAFTLIGDELDMWKTTYGRNGQGYCIITPLEAFDQVVLNESKDLHGGEEIKVTEDVIRALEPLPLKLYAVRYNEADVKSTLNELKPSLERIIERKKVLSGSTKILDRTVRIIISHILYLYKNKFYAKEKEVRLVSPFDISYEGLKLDSSSKPSKIYVESLDFLLSKGSRIIIGPTVPVLDQTIAELDLKYRLARHGHVEVKVSRSNLTNMYR